MQQKTAAIQLSLRPIKALLQAIILSKRDRKTFLHTATLHFTDFYKKKIAFLSQTRLTQNDTALQFVVYVDSWKI